jgi:hypothetical protein
MARALRERGFFCAKEVSEILRYAQNDESMERPDCLRQDWGVSASIVLHWKCGGKAAKMNLNHQQLFFLHSL